MNAAGIPEHPAPSGDHWINAPVEAPLLRCAPWMALGTALAILAGYLVSGVQLFADGGFFAFAFLTGDPWGFHFANIPARACAFLVTIVPPFLAARAVNASAAIGLYGFIFGLLPLAGLIATFALAGNRRILLFCSLSTVVILPFSVFFPSETLVTHALFWPLLAYLTGRRDHRVVTTLLFMLALAFSHEGGAVLLLLLMLFLMADGWARPKLIAAAAVVLAAWLAVKLLVPVPYASTRAVLVLNMLGTLNLAGVVRPLSVAIAVGFAVYGLGVRRAGDDGRRPARLIALAALALVPAFAILLASEHWFVGRHDNLLVGRYNFRTTLLGAPALLLVLLTIAALPEERKPAWFGRIATAGGRLGPRLPALVFGLMVIATACHVMDGWRFLRAWRDYAGEIRAVALGRSHRVPAYAEILPALRPAPVQRLDRPGRTWSMSWGWSDPFLSIVLALPQPAEALVYRPGECYVPFSYETMQRADRAALRLPAESYDLLLRYVYEHSDPQPPASVRMAGSKPDRSSQP